MSDTKKNRAPGGLAVEKLQRASDELHDAGREIQEAATSLSEAGERVATTETAASLRREISDRTLAELKFSVAQLKEQVSILMNWMRHSS